uniref:Reverse transcriptase domain-containing protein n=1 Tax=Tanacetum cinerariifolium TaxID=118510 RepID=A0A699GZR5_TANCI|nr:reverse transcriptase domain-containing protein [Tanacetum cinerariifolium]
MKGDWPMRMKDYDRGEHRSKTGPDRTETELVQNSGPWTGPKWYGPGQSGPELTHLAPQLHNFGISLDFDFDLWARKVPELWIFDNLSFNIYVVSQSRRVARWAIEHEEHGIEFKPKNSIKAQILADFLAETQEEDDETDLPDLEKKKEHVGWKLYTDGASSKDSLGAELMIVSPEGMQFTYALKLEFKATNNKAEYEGVIVRIRIAREMKIEEITVFLDS